jgi:hypothetical protein
VPDEGDRYLISCEGGPSRSRLVHWPFPLEIVERGGLYVLRDVGPVDEWAYVWVPSSIS